MDNVFDYDDNKVEEDIENLIDTTALNDVPRRTLRYSSKCNRMQETRQICETSKLSSDISV